MYNKYTKQNKGENNISWLIVIIVWLICGFICEYLGNLKGQKGCLLYGLLFGIIGVIIVLCLKDKSGDIEANNNENKYENLEMLLRKKLTYAQFKESDPEKDQFRDSLHYNFDENYINQYIINN